MSARWSAVLGAGILVYIALNIAGLVILQAARRKGPSEDDDASNPVGGENSLHLVNR